MNKLAIAFAALASLVFSGTVEAAPQPGAGRTVHVTRHATPKSHHRVAKRCRGAHNKMACVHRKANKHNRHRVHHSHYRVHVRHH
ncbi:MAG: hypothetical protein LBV50_03075 [Novosphingobium sp.]|nr:hypothetical protein [Novosphingobium sp.]